MAAHLELTVGGAGRLSSVGAGGRGDGRQGRKMTLKQPHCEGEQWVTSPPVVTLKGYSPEQEPSPLIRWELGQLIH